MIPNSILIHDGWYA